MPIWTVKVSEVRIVVSWPPCRDPVDVKKLTGLPLRLPLQKVEVDIRAIEIGAVLHAYFCHKEPQVSKKVFTWPGSVPKRVP